MLHWFLPYNSIISHKYTNVPILLEPPSHRLPHHIPPLYVVTEYWAELAALCNNFSLAIYFTYDNVYVSVLLSQFLPPSPSPTVSTSLSSMSLCSYPENRFIGTIFLVSTYMCLVYDICSSLSDLLHSQ